MDGELSDQFEDVLRRSESGISIAIVLPSAPLVMAVGSEDSLPLVGADVYESSPTSMVPAHVSPAPLLSTDVGGSVRLPCSARVRHWFVGAQGRATKVLTTSPGAGNYVVRLERSGKIEVRCSGIVPGPLAVIAIRGGSHGLDVPQFMELALDRAAGAYRADGLAAGRWRVVVGTQGERLPAVQLGSAWAEVIAGDVTNVDVACDEPSTRCVVRGSISVPAEWRDTPTHVALRGRSPSNASVDRTFRVASSGRDRAFAADDVLPGAYLVTVFPIGFCSTMVVGQLVQQTVLQLPPPVDVRIALGDALDGHGLTEASVVVYCKQATQGQEVPPESVEETIDAEYDPAVRCYVAQVPPGELAVEASCAGYVLVRTELGFFGSGGISRSLVLGRAGEIRVQLKRNGVIDAAAVETVTVQTLDSPGGAMLVIRVALGEGRAMGLAGGEYLVEWATEGGALLSKRVSVQPGETSTVEFHRE